MLGGLVTFFAGVFAILGLGWIDAGAVGISLTYATSFTDNILWLVRLYAMNEQNMNSVERIKEYLDVEQEADAIVEKNRPPENWPSKGEVEFVNYSTRYRKELEQVLKKLTFKIEPRQKVGIVGRTGAGKSSLALAIFRALEADEGKILIDGIEIGTIGLQDLRQAITIVPQDPTLFMGTLRSNLDPFDMYTDEEIFSAIRRVHLIGPNEPTATAAPAAPAASTTPLIEVTQPEEEGSTQPSTPTLATNKNVFLDLSSTVTESGNNLSQGQRQLLCLARAMLLNPSVLVMDEATASIDYTTDSKIQETIRELTSTIITIAHRLQTIVDYDRVLVLDKGEVVEFGHPWELIQNEEGMFRGMCESSSEFDALKKSARKAFESGKPLIDASS
jgi:ABC-type multidrug transport system fused ATPase/permease subunit